MGRDMWSEWLLRRHFGGDAQRMQAVLDFLRPVRDTENREPGTRVQENLSRTRIIRR